MKNLPTMADVQLQRSPFQAGDRLVIKTGIDLSPEQIRKAVRGVTKMTGTEVNVITVNIVTTRMVVERIDEKGIRHWEEITKADKVSREIANSSKIKIELTKVDFWKDDILWVFVNHPLKVQQKIEWEHILKNWAGNDVDVRLKVPAL